VTRRPDFFIIGAPKSGTTSLYDYLADHPDVYEAPVKEPFYFSPDVQGGLRRRFNYGTDDAKYMALFSEAGDKKRVGEASTRYLVSHVAPGYIREFQPDARVIAMLRNPVDFVYALHNERFSQGAEDVGDFETALGLDDARRAGRSLPPGSNPLGAVYRDNALFGGQLSHWLEIFPRDQVMVIIFDDFVRDTPTKFKEVLEFLEIDPTYQPETFAVSNPSHRLRGGVVRMVLSSRPAHFGAHRLLPAVIGQNSTSRLANRVRHSRLNRRPNPRPPLSAELRRQLEADFSDDVVLLGQLLGRDLQAEWFHRPAMAAGGGGDGGGGALTAS
jgi:Sulfotransferase domain